jgi:hypothetical protein
MNLLGEGPQKYCMKLLGEDSTENQESTVMFSKK